MCIYSYFRLKYKIMKSNLLFSLLFSQIVFAQTTITKAFNDPVVGNVVNNSQVVGTVNNTGTGAGVTYNNASLTGGPGVPMTYSTPTATEIASYPGSTIKSSDGANTSYYKQSATKLELTGTVSPAATINFNAQNAVIMTYPLVFGNTASNQAKGTFTSTAASGLMKGTVAINADANGTLVLGTNTYTNILRVKITQNFNLYQSTDTSYLFAIGTMTGTSYQYYSTISKFPLLSYSEGNVTVPLMSINQNSSEATAQSFTVLGTKDFKFVEDFIIYPNPAQDVIIVKGKENSGLNAMVYSEDGRLLKNTKLNDGKMDISTLKSGVYFLELQCKNTNKKLKFIKN